MLQTVNQQTNHACFLCVHVRDWEFRFRCQCPTGYYPIGDSCYFFSHCSPGSFQTRVPTEFCLAGTTGCNRECPPCASNTYQPNTNQLNCLTMTNCPPGQVIQKQGTSTSNRECRPVKDGHFTATTNSLTEAPFRVWLVKHDPSVSFCSFLPKNYPHIVGFVHPC